MISTGTVANAAGAAATDPATMPASAERPPRLAAEIAGCLEQRARHALETGPDRQDHVRQPQVGEDDPHTHVAGLRNGRAQRLEDPIDDAVVGEHRSPRIDLDQVAGPQRHQYARDEQRLGPRARDPGHEHRDRERDDHVRDRHERRDRDGSEDDRAIDRLVDDRLEVVERQGLDEQAGEFVQPPERGDQQDRQRAEVDDAEPAHRRHEQRGGAHAWAPPRCSRKARPSACHQPLIAVQACTHCG